jgi:DNA polymerase III delta subunit
MEKRKNIIVLTGKNQFRIHQESERFVQAFRERQDAQSIDRYRIEEIRNWNDILQETQTLGLFAEKRLFIFEGTLEKLKTRKTKNKKEEDLKDAEFFLRKICEEAPSETFIIFSGVSMTSGELLSSWLQENADIRMYDDLWTHTDWQKIFPSLDPSLIQALLIQYKTISASVENISHEDLSFQIAHSLMKLSLLRETKTLQTSDIQETLTLIG